MTNPSRDTLMVLLVFFFLALLLVLDFSSPGYILTLDMVFSDSAFQASGLNSFYGFVNSYSVSPFIAFLGFLDLLFPVEFIQKISFFLIFFISGVSAYKLCPEEWGIGRYFAGFLYMLNPFVYVRFLAGHWLLLLAYAVAPLVVKRFMYFFEAPSARRAILVAFLLTFVFVLETHTTFLLLIVFCIFFLSGLIEYRKIDCRGLSKSAVLAGLFLLVLNSYWLFPGFIGSSAPLGEITTSDLYAFTTKQDFNFNTLFTIESMYGFWRIGYVYAKDLLPYWYLFFVLILVLAVHGFISNYDHPRHGMYVKAFGAVAVLSVLLATGVSGPFKGVFEYLFSNVFFFKGFREPQKFVALLVLAYAYLGASGVAELEKIARTGGGLKLDPKTIIAWVVIVIALSVPFIYSFTMFNGFWGQVRPADYPEDWYEINEFLNQDRQDFNVLFLPWHLYMDFKWIPNTQKRIANPASVFFEKHVIQGENMEAGTIYSQSSNPAQRYVESLLLDKNNMTDFGEKMVLLNVKYVLLTKEVDYRGYFFLFNQTDLEFVKETPNFYLFKNNHPVSRFYLSPRQASDEQSGFISALKPLSYTQNSPVRFSVKADAGYIVFVPPNLDSRYWELDRRSSSAVGFYAIYEAGEGTVYYRRFDTYLTGYIISLVALAGLVVWYRRRS